MGNHYHLAWRIWKEISVSQRWIAERLDLKTPANTSQLIRRFAAVENSVHPAEIRRWKELMKDAD